MLNILIQKDMKKIVTLLSFGFLLTFIGCNMQLMEDPVGSVTDFSLSVEAASPSNGSPETRSSYASNLQNKITDFTIFVFDAEGRFVSSNYYGGSENMKGRDLFINEEMGTTFDDRFEVYVIANLGDLRSSSALCTDGVPASGKMRDYAYSFSKDFSEFNDKGFPMAGYYKSYCPSTDPRTLYANKIVTQYNIRFTKSSSNPNTYTITGGQLVNVANKCTPFKTFKANDGETSGEGDNFSPTDISELNSGSYRPFFVLENEQGIAFPSDITDEKDKKLENINDGYKRICSYVEFYVTVKTATATYDNVIYRYFFGDNVRDCSIHRNMVYDLTMNFDNVFVEDEGWRIEPGKPDVDENSLVLSREQLSIIKGMSNTFSVTRKTGVEYDMVLDQALASKLGVTLKKTTSGNVDTYTVSTSYMPERSGSGWIPKVNYEDVPVTFLTKDGLLRKIFTVRVNKNPFLIDVDFPNGYLTVNFLEGVDWPDNTLIECDFKGTLYSENVYCNNRLFNRYTLDVWTDDIKACSYTFALLPGDARYPAEKKENVSWRILDNQLLATSRSRSHAYAVGSSRNHYPLNRRVDMKMYLGIKINGEASDVPFAYFASNIHSVAPDQNSYYVVYDAPVVSISEKASHYPAAGDYEHTNKVDNDLFDVSYSTQALWYINSAAEHELTFSASGMSNQYNSGSIVADGYCPEKYYKMTVNGNETSSRFNPTIQFGYKQLVPGISVAW